ncbi:alpha/beta fold hydrolase [Psychroserpens sp. MEBiC05023]
MRQQIYFSLFLFICLSCQSQEDHSCVFKGQISIQHDRCGYVDVPNNWGKKSNGNTQIAYLVIASKSANRKEDPVIFLQGGPGGSVLPLANVFKNLSLDSDRDFIMYDQRGMGFSNEICPGLSSKFLDIMSADIPLNQEDEALIEISKDCIKTLSSSNFKTAFGSTESAKDIEALRLHLGYKQLNLFGGSYGTRLGLKYMELYPSKVRTSILSGLFPPNIRLYDNIYTNLNRSLNKLFNTCDNDENCSKKYPNLRDEFKTICTALDKAPKTFSNGNENIVINKQDFLLLIQQMLYDRRTISEAPSFIMAFKNEDSNAVIESIQAFASRLGIINVAAYWSVMTIDEGTFGNAKSLANDGQQHATLSSGISLFTSDPDVIKVWPSQNNKNKTMKAVASDVPTLLVSGDWDPITPPSNAENAAKSLRNANHVVFPNDGHCPMNQCFFSIAKSFLNHPRQNIDDSCTSATQSIRFN